MSESSEFLICKSMAANVPTDMSIIIFFILFKDEIIKYIHRYGEDTNLMDILYIDISYQIMTQSQNGISHTFIQLLNTICVYPEYMPVSITAHARSLKLSSSPLDIAMLPL